MVERLYGHMVEVIWSYGREVIWSCGSTKRKFETMIFPPNFKSMLQSF